MPEGCSSTWPPATAFAGSPMSGQAWCQTSTKSWKLDGIKRPCFPIKWILIAGYFKLLLNNQIYLYLRCQRTSRECYAQIDIDNGSPLWTVWRLDMGPGCKFQLQLWLNVAQPRKFGEIRRNSEENSEKTPVSQKKWLSSNKFGHFLDFERISDTKWGENGVQLERNFAQLEHNFAQLERNFKKWLFSRFSNP